MRLDLQAVLLVLGLALPGLPTRTSTTVFDLNRATRAQLESLPGIGPSRAEAILARRQRRPFRRVTELIRIPGIGRKTLRRLRKRLRVQPPVRRRTGMPPADRGRKK